MTAPLVVTLLLDDAAQASFDRLRQAHFPPDRNHLAAHVTLFHALPGEHERLVVQDLREHAARPPFEVEVTGPRLLGRGVALALSAPALQALRANLAQAWRPWLTPQDSRPHAPHVTVQNKVTPAAARALLEELAAGFEPWTARATGLGLWRYLGGPWAPVTRVPFEGLPPQAAPVTRSA